MLVEVCQVPKCLMPLLHITFVSKKVVEGLNDMFPSVENVWHPTKYNLYPPSTEQSESFRERRRPNPSCLIFRTSFIVNTAFLEQSLFLFAGLRSPEPSHRSWWCPLHLKNSLWWLCWGSNPEPPAHEVNPLQLNYLPVSPQMFF